MLVNWNTVNNTQWLKACFYLSSLSTSTHEANLLKVVTKNNLQSSACSLLFIIVWQQLMLIINGSGHGWSYLAAQKKMITTDVVNSKIFKLSVSPLCRLCHSADEATDHLISSCSYIAQTQYKKRHDLGASYIHWNLAKLAGLCVHEQWWKHVPRKFPTIQTGRFYGTTQFRQEVPYHIISMTSHFNKQKGWNKIYQCWDSLRFLDFSEVCRK